MPHVNSSGGDDLASSDEIKVYNHEGEEETEKKSSENLSEDKLGLVTETEEDKHGLSRESYPSPGNDKPVDPGRPDDGKIPLSFHPADRGMVPGSFMLPPYYPNGTSVHTSLGGKMAMVQPHYPYPVMYPGNNHEFASPPPAHMGIPPVSIDPKTGTPTWLPRPHIYAIPPPSQFPHPLYSPEFSQVQWQRSPSYPITSSALGGPYPPSLLQAGALPRFGPGGFIPPPGLPIPGMPHPAIITPGPKQEIPHHIGQENHSSCFVYRPGMHPDQAGSSHSHHSTPEPERKPHIKKPLNAFMLFMKEQRATVVAECTLKESAAINQILGRRWHALDRSEQAKYYEMARKEKELHQQLYPGWSARDNYAIVAKKKKVPTATLR